MNLKEAYVKTFVITVLVIFSLVLISLVFENMRIYEIRDATYRINVLWNDVKFIQKYIENTSTCADLVEENRKIGDRIYEEGLRVGKYEAANKFSDLLLAEQQNYALLDLQFWENSRMIKEKCPGEFSTIAYFYSKFNGTNEQRVMDMLLLDFKYRCGPKTVYITFPIDLNVSSINLFMKKYNITSVPSILIDEKYKFEGLVKIDDLNNIIKCW